MGKFSKFLKDVFSEDPISMTVANTDSNESSKKEISQNANNAELSDTQTDDKKRDNHLLSENELNQTDDGYRFYDTTSETEMIPDYERSPYSTGSSDYEIQRNYLLKKLDKLMKGKKGENKRTLAEVFQSGDYKPMNVVPTAGNEYRDFWHFNEYMAHATGGVYYVPISKSQRDYEEEHKKYPSLNTPIGREIVASNFYDCEGRQIPWRRPEADKYRVNRAQERNKEFLDSITSAYKKDWPFISEVIIDNRWPSSIKALRYIAATIPSTKMTIADTLLPDYQERVDFVTQITEERFGDKVALYRMAAILACFMPLDVYDWHKTDNVEKELRNLSALHSEQIQFIKTVFDWILLPEVDAMLFEPTENNVFVVEHMTELRNLFIEHGLYVFQPITEEIKPYNFNREDFFHSEYAKCLRDLADIKYPESKNRLHAYTPDFLVTKGYNDRLVVTNGWCEFYASGQRVIEPGEYIYDPVNGASVCIVANDKKDMIQKMYTYVPDLIKFGASVYFMPEKLSIIICATHWNAKAFFDCHPELLTTPCTSNPDRTEDLYWKSAGGCVYLLIDRSLYETKQRNFRFDRLDDHRYSWDTLDNYIKRFQTDLTYGELMRFLQDTTNNGMEKYALWIHHELKLIDIRRVQTQGFSMRYSLNKAVASAIDMYGKPSRDWDYDRDERYGSISDSLPLTTFVDINKPYYDPQTVDELESMKYGGKRRLKSEPTRSIEPKHSAMTIAAKQRELELKYSKQNNSGFDASDNRE